MNRQERSARDAERASRIHRPARAGTWFAGYVIAIASSVSDAHGAPPTADARSVRPGAPSASLLYPERLKVPKDIPAVSEDYDPLLETTFVVLPVATYAVCHYEGWQECLFQFGRNGIDVDHREVIGVSIKLSGTTLQYTILGLKDGFEECREEIAGLRKHYSVDELRKMARECYKPLYDSMIRPRRNAWPDGALGKPSMSADYAESRLVTRPTKSSSVRSAHQPK